MPKKPTLFFEFLAYFHQKNKKTSILYKKNLPLRFFLK
jgi:hypothetical protein